MDVAGFFRKVDDLLNPVLVKEVRQSLHSRSIQNLLGGLALLELGILFLLVQSSEENIGVVDFAFSIGLLAIILWILIAFCCRRFEMERRREAPDLIHITQLSARQLIAGKFWAAVLLEVQLFAVVLPFLMISFYLRGPEMGEILKVAALFFFGAWPVLLLGLLVAGFGSRWSVGVLFVLTFPVFLMSLALSAPSSDYFPDDFSWLPYYGIFWLSLILFCAAVAVAGQPGSNRIRPLRLALGLAALGILPGFVLLSGYYEGNFFGQWGTVILLFAGVVALVAALEEEAPGRRVLAELPERGPWRVAVLLFSDGAGSGLVFALLLAVVGIGICGWREQMVSGVGYLFFYAGVALWLRRHLRLLQIRYGGGAALLMVLIVLVLLPIIVTALTDLKWLEHSTTPVLLLPSIFSMHFDDSLAFGTGIVGGGIGLLLSGGLLLRWFRLAFPRTK